MAIKIASNLSRNRYGGLHFRLAIPPDLRSHFKVKEIYRSLRTASVKDAVDQAQTLSIALKRAFAAIRQKSMSRKKKTSVAHSGAGNDLGVGLMLEFHVTGGLSKFQTEAYDTPEVIQAALATIATMGTHHAPAAVVAAPTSLFSDLVQDYRRDRLASEKWTSKTEGENLAVCGGSTARQTVKATGYPSFVRHGGSMSCDWSEASVQ